MMSVAAAAMAFISCEKVNEEDAPAAPSEGTIPVSISTGEIETKTSYDPEAKKIYWIKEDEIGVVPEDAKENYQFTQTAYGGTKTTTTFTGEVKAAGKHYAYYPYNATMSIGTGPKVSLSDWQVMPSTGSFNADADILLSEEFNVAASGSNSFDKLRFRRLGAFIDIQFKAGPSLTLDLTSESLCSVTITAESDLVGDCFLDPKTGTFGAIIDGSHSVYVGRAASALVYSSHTFAGVYPQTLAAGSKLIIEADLNQHKIHKEVTVPAGGITLKAGHIQPLKINLNDADFVPVLRRVWGFYNDVEKKWYDTEKITAVSIAHPDGYGMARSLAMDDEYVYLPKSSGYQNVAAISITNPATQKALNVTGVAGGSEFATSFVRVIKNADPSVNDGKDVLLLCNLTSTNSDANQLRLYAYKNGVDSAPAQIAGFCWDAANSVNDWRRYGDRFFVTGTYQEGKVYFPSYNENKSVILSIANGARTAVTQIAAGAANSPTGIKDLTVYPGDNKLFIHNVAVANLVAPTGGKSNGWDEYTLSGSSSKAVGTFGYNFFEFNGKSYIAYARISDGNKAWIEVIEDKGDLLSSLEAQDGLMKSPIHDASDLDKTSATGNIADCCVRVISGVVYIAALTRDGGFVLDTMVL